MTLVGWDQPNFLGFFFNSRVGSGVPSCALLSVWLYVFFVWWDQPGEIFVS